MVFYFWARQQARKVKQRCFSNVVGSLMEQNWPIEGGKNTRATKEGQLAQKRMQRRTKRDWGDLSEWRYHERVE